MIFHFMPVLTSNLLVYISFFCWNKVTCWEVPLTFQRQEAIFSSSMKKKNEKKTLSQAHTASLTMVVCQTGSHSSEILGKAIRICVRLSQPKPLSCKHPAQKQISDNCHRLIFIAKAKIGEFATQEKSLPIPEMSPTAKL